MRAQVESMKSTMVERVSKAARARYARRASPNAHQQKDQTTKISLQEKEDSTWVGQIRISLRPPSMLSDGIDLFDLATTDKNDCRDKTEMIDAAHSIISSALNVVMSAASWRRSA